MTLESRKLPGISLVPVEFKVVRQATAKCAQSLQQFLARRLPRDIEPATIGNVNLDFVTLF
jgi:hypothetical protein